MTQSDDELETPTSAGATEAPPDENEPSERQERRRRLERGLREVVRRAVERGVEAGVGTFSKADRAVRGVVDDVPLPKEIVSFLFSQVDDTKNALVRVVANEIRDFLEATDLSGELQKALTSLSFEIKTEVRFIPNDAGGVRPQVRARAAPRVKRRDSSAPDSMPPEGDDEEG
ncbi:MAG: hypothetical protein KF901_09220 [Myxococcales bacterium]|nr:hypothetical protein [Myxococcales bacterium]